MLEPGLTKLLRDSFVVKRFPAPQSRRLDIFFVHIINQIRSKTWFSIMVGALFAGIGLLLRLAVIGPTIVKVPYVTFFPVITMAAVFGGMNGGTAAIVLSAFLLHRYFVPLAELEDWIELSFFVGSNILTTSIVEMLYRAQTRAAKAEAAQKAVEWSAARDELLSKTAAQLLQSPDPKSIIRGLCQEVMDFLGCDVFLNFLFEERSGRLYLNACAGVSEEEASTMRSLDCGGTPCLLGLEDSTRVISAKPRASGCPQTKLLESLGVRCYCCHPLLEQGRVIGTLTFGDRARSGFDAATVEVTEAVSRLMSLALSRIRIETALRESEERFSRFMRHLMAYAWIKDDRGRYVFVNEAFAKVTATPLDQVLGKTDEELFGVETAAEFREHDRFAVKNPVGLTTIEHLTDNSGSRRHYLVSKFPMPSGFEQETYVGGVAIDDTERARAEDRLQQATEKLREADRRKDEFLATLAHELRNPLTPIRSGLHVLRRTAGHGPVPEKLHGIMERQVDHLVRLVDDLLEVSRINRGAIELKKEPLDLASVIENAVETSRQSIDAANLELRVDLCKEPLRIEADPVRLTQIITNLLNNAAKYTDPGGRVDVRAERQGDEAVVSVADTGVGIPAEMLPRVFDLFAQVDRTLGRAQGGLGIGLALVRKLVELHGGGVEATSEGEGKGSRFVIRLRLAAVAVDEHPDDGPPAALVATPSRRVLVVDDTPDVADSLALLMKTLGVDVRVAYSGARGLASLAEFKPEIVFLDIGMPGMDGFETARRMREHPQGRDVALVALTGWGEEETRRRVEASGFDRHLIKPAQIDDLRQALELADRFTPVAG